ncbi:unnamed protein product [Rotaria sp. Silwood2]|nr:unnamed protein product [Rotaria sp. Silwood2]
MGYVSYILNKKWLDKCNDAKCFLPVEESDWLLDDELKPPRNLLKQSIDKRISRKNKSLYTDLHKHNNTDFEIKILSIDFVLESIVQQEILNIDTFIMKV